MFGTLAAQLNAVAAANAATAAQMLVDRGQSITGTATRIKNTDMVAGDVEPLDDTEQSGRIGREIAVVGIIVGSPGVHEMVLIGHGGQSPKKTGIHHAHGDGISP